MQIDSDPIYAEMRLADEANLEVRDALEALRRETDFRKETSIRRRMRRLALEEAPLSDIDRQVLAKKVVAAYDLRGSVVHTGTLDPNALAEANETALHALKMILRSRLGFAIAPATYS